MQKQKRLPEEVKASLRAMGVATEMMEEFLAIQENNEVKDLSEQVLSIKKHMQKPEWSMDTRISVMGVIDEGPKELELTSRFLIDTKTLIECVDRMKTTDTTPLNEVMAVLKNKENGEELAKVIRQAYLPRSYGVTDVVEVKTLVGLEPVTGAVEGVVELSVDSGSVHFEFVKLLNVWLPDPVGVDSELFGQNCWVNWEFLLDHEPFSKDFAWEDTTNPKPLSLKVETKWEMV